MRNAKRGRGSRHGVYFGAAAAVGLALSGCGGGGSSSAASAVSTSAQSTAAATAAATAPAQSTPTDSGSTTSSTSGDKPGSTSGGKSGGTTSAKTGSGSTGGTTPVAHANTVTINWTPPTENTNGSPLTNLAGYDIHYGTSSGNLSQKIAVSNPGIATYVVSNLSAGRYYFAVAAVNSAGTESPLSSQVSATVTN